MMRVTGLRGCQVRKRPRVMLALLVAGVAGCTGLQDVGREPALSPLRASTEHNAMLTYSLPEGFGGLSDRSTSGSLWAGNRESLLGDRRAMTRGDILTVVIEIDDRAEISNSSNRSRSANQQMAVSSLFGIPQRLNPRLPEGASLDPAVQLGSSSTASGDGSIRRNEKLTLRVAATIIDVLPNGVLSIEGSQEVRVNYELRELLVSGYVRPQDISRQNQVTYDNIAAARISYGGRGQISQMQQPRYGQQIVETLLPF